MKNIVLSFVLVVAFLSGIAENPREITLEKIWLKGTFSQKHVRGLRSMNDGIHYSVLEKIEDKQVINKYSYEKGKLVETIMTNTFSNSEGEVLRIEGYEFSGNESKILFKTESERIYRHSMRSAYYLYDISKKSISRIGATKFQLASFSPDGNYISYVRDNNLYIYDLTKNKEVAITSDGLKNSIINGAPDWVYEEEFALVKAYDWSSDSKCLAFYRFDESNVREYSFPVYGNLYPQNYVYKYPKAGEENAKVSIIIHHIENNKQVPVRLTRDYEYVPRIKWVPSNGMLSVQGMNREQNLVDLMLVNRNTGESYTLMAESNSTYLEVQDVYFYKNQNAFLWQSEKSNYNHIYYYEYELKPDDFDGADLIKTTMDLVDETDVVTNLIGVNEELNKVYYQFTDKYNPTDRFIRARVIYPKEDEDMHRLNLPIPGGYSRISPSKGVKYLVVYNSTVRQPQVVSVHNKEGHPIRTIEENKALQDTLKNYHISFKQFFKFNNRNGDELVGWMLKPPNFSPTKKYPVFMYVYGGPGSQTAVNSFGGSNDMWFQYLAHQGYIVVSVDNRGTGGRSRDFRTGTYGQLGKLETEDQIDAAKHFAHMNFVDENRIGIWGWSYGGYMSTLCLAKGSDIFKMAIAVAPVSNWRYYDSIYTERYMGLPDQNGESYDDNSPINHVGKIKGKYLLVHGTADDNVHFQNTTELISALVKNNVQFDLAVYPDKNHGIYGGNTRYHLYTKMTDFILENL